MCRLGQYLFRRYTSYFFFLRDKDNFFVLITYIVEKILI